MPKALKTEPNLVVLPKFSLTGLNQGRIGSDRIQLLRAIQTEGSIAKAAKAVGISYKAAWDAVLAMNNLFPTPLVDRQAGGTRGGGALLTDRGQMVLLAMEDAMKALGAFAQTLTAMDASIDQGETGNLWSVMMKTSARNAIRATVTTIQPGAVNAEVDMDYGDGRTLTAIVTQDSVDDLGLMTGGTVTALIKSSFIILCAPDAAPGISARNKITGIITDVRPGSVNTEVILDIGGGKTLAAIVTEVSAKDLGYKKGDAVVALVKASHVILASA